MLRFESEPACPSKLLIARCYSTIRARIRPNGFERILAHRISCQRATASLSSRVASKQLCNYSGDGRDCQHPETETFGFPQSVFRLLSGLLACPKASGTVQRNPFLGVAARSRHPTALLKKEAPLSELPLPFA